MNPYARNQQQSTPSWTRIDMLLALFDGGVERCEQALAALERQDHATAQKRLLKARLIVMGLMSGVLNDGDPVTTTILQLYEYCLHSLTQGRIEDVKGARNVLCILREGFLKIRPEANTLERSGAIPPINTTSTLQALA